MEICNKSTIKASSSRRFSSIRLVFLLVNACHQSVSSFVIAPSIHEHERCSLLSQRPTLSQQRHTLLSQGQSALFLVADAAFAEEEKEKNKRIRKKKDYWIETSDGGFLPNIRRKFANRKLPKAPPLIHEVLTIEEYKDVVVDESDQMVVVRFYAPWCKACRAVAPLFQKLAKKHAGRVKFVEVPVTKENSYLHQGLGIPSLPFGHIYHPNVGLVEEAKVNKKDGHFQQFEKTLETYLVGECAIPDEDGEANGGSCSSSHFYHESGNDNEFQ